MAAKEEFNVGPRIYGPSGQLIFAHDTGIRSKELIYDPPRHLRLLIVCVAAAECSPFAQPASTCSAGWMAVLPFAAFEILPKRRRLRSKALCHSV